MGSCRVPSMYWPPVQWVIWNKLVICATIRTHIRTAMREREIERTPQIFNMEKSRQLAAPVFLHHLIATLIQKRIDEIQHIFSILPEDTTRAGAIAVDAERRHAGDNVAIAEEVGSAGIAETRAAGICIVRK